MGNISLECLSGDFYCTFPPWRQEGKTVIRKNFASGTGERHLEEVVMTTVSGEGGFLREGGMALQVEEKCG